MYFVAAHSWQQPTDKVAETIANTMGILVFEARQKISNGGPAILTSFADRSRAEELASRLSQAMIPTLVIDPIATRSHQPRYVSSFVIEPQALQLTTVDGENFSIDYAEIEFLLVAIGVSRQIQTTAVVTKRKFSLGKTLLAGGLPMTKKVQSEKAVMVIERDKTLWLYTRQQAPFVFNRATLNYEGLGDEMQLTRDLNFKHLKTKLRRLAAQAVYDERLLRRAEQVNLLGPSLDPDVDLDLAFDILARSLRPESAQDNDK
jgi:hypothetical protein